MIDMAHDMLGLPAILYRSPDTGMTASPGYDCSGFISALVQQASIAYDIELSIPRHANEQFRLFGEYVHYSRREPGDFVYFVSRRKIGTYIIGHVGLVIGEHEYIHSPGRDDTVISRAQLPDMQSLLPPRSADDMYSSDPAGIKRVSLPVHEGRWHAY